MDIRGWDERYRSREHRGEALESAPTPLLIEAVSALPPGRALDLACGAGRNAVWLAERGWRVTAVDGAPAAIALLCDRARSTDLPIEAHVADLSGGGFRVEPEAYDLVAICYYLQRDLFEAVKSGVKPGGHLLAIVHITEGAEEPTASRLRPGELQNYFAGWEVLHNSEGASRDPAHRRPAAEVFARRPAPSLN